jgi:hypothetical protein
MKIRFLAILFIISVPLPGQVPVIGQLQKEDPYIRWVTSLSSGNKVSETGFFEKIFNFIVGYEPVVFSSPVNVFANGIQDYWIVNQGDGSILHWLNGSVEKAHAFKKDNSSFPSLIGICSYNSNDLLLTDSKLNRVFLLQADGKQLSLFSDTSRLERPTGIAFCRVTNEIWVVETGSHRISILDKNGKRIRTIGSRGTGPLEFNFPTYIWIDASGKVYIVDSMNFRVQILSSKGEFITSFGKQGNATGYFARPRGIATDSQGNIYVVDALFNVVQIFDAAGRLLYYFGSQGNGNYQFWMPSGIFIDKNDFIYVSDSYNGRVQIFQLVKNNQK